MTGEWTPKRIAERFGVTEAAIDGFLFKGYWKNLISPFVREKLKEVSKAKHNRKLTAEKAAEIREIHKTQKHNMTQLGKLFGVSRYTVRDVINNKTWKNLD